MTSWVRVHAPVRVLDAGGWTDTWFARRGTVCHLAVDGGTNVLASFVEGGGPGTSGMVDLSVPAFGDRYRFPLNEPPGRHPLLEASLRRWAPPGRHIEVAVASTVPPGSGLGTSASVVVALIGALRALAGQPIDPVALARAAHNAETIDVGLQSGVQDQIAAAHGGCNLITIDPYPEVTVLPVDMAPATWNALTHRLLTIYLGAPHGSSALHEVVIAHLSGAEGGPLLASLGAAARDAAAALSAGDLAAYGEAMIANTRAQEALHPALVSPLARDVIELAKQHGAIGWKVNGAGGDGGSLTIVGPDEPGGLAKALGSIPRTTALRLPPTRQGARIVDQA